MESPTAADLADLLRGTKQRLLISGSLSALNQKVLKYEKARIAISQQRVLPPILSYIPPPSKTVNAQLCPVRIEVEHSKLRDILLLDPHTPEPVLSHICARILQDYHLPLVPSEVSAMVESVATQLKDFRDYLERWEAAREALPNPLPNLVIKLDLLFRLPPLQVIDQIEWALGDQRDGDIGAFAAKYAKELGLPTEAIMSVTFSIREQLYLARRALLAAGLDPANDESLQALLVTAPSNGGIMRNANLRDAFTPLVEHLNEVALDRAEQSHERAYRRRKRAQLQASKRRRGDAWSITGSPPRVYCTPLGSRLDTTTAQGSDAEDSNVEDAPVQKRRRAVRKK